jgi:cell division protein FtsL
MNNLKYYNDSLAYDFEMFAPKTAERSKSRDNIVVMPDRASKKRTRSATKAVSAPAMLIMTAVLVLAGLCGNIALRLQINEVNSQINSVRAQIAEVDSEKTELEMEMQRRISYSNLELEAVQLGMKKPEKENVVYIRVNDKNAAQTADGTFVVSE